MVHYLTIIYMLYYLASLFYTCFLKLLKHLSEFWIWLIPINSTSIIDPFFGYPIAKTNFAVSSVNIISNKKIYKSLLVGRCAWWVICHMHFSPKMCEQITSFGQSVWWEMFDGLWEESSRSPFKWRYQINTRC